jgi:hypothetical protein
MSALNGHVMDDELQQERERLEAEIAAAKARAAVARDRTANRDRDMRAALKIEVEASQARLAEMERQHQVAVEMLHDATQAEVQRILSEARRHATTIEQLGEQPGDGGDHER